MTTIGTLEGGSATFPMEVRRQLRGKPFVGSTVAEISYTHGLINNTNLNAGVSALNSWVNGTAGVKLVVGADIGAAVISKWLSENAAGCSVPVNDLSFICMANPARRYNGIFANAYTSSMLDWTPWQNLTAVLAPSNPKYVTIDIARQYTWADWPDGLTYPADLTRMSVRNAMRGGHWLHDRYEDIALDDPDNQTYTVGNITYLLARTDVVPIAGIWPSRHALKTDNNLRPIIEADYNRPYGALVAVPVDHLLYHEDDAMALPDDFKTVLCEAFTGNVDHVSLHTADPGITGANDSGITHAVVTWEDPADGISTALVEFASVSGDYTHIGLWEGATFRQAIRCEFHYTTPVAVSLLITHKVGDSDE